MMPKPLIVLVVGHSEKHPGARAVAPLSIHEYTYNKDLCFIVCDELKIDFDTKIILRDERTIEETYEVIREINPDACIELHFNSSTNKTVRGTETLCCEKSIAFAIRVQAELCDVLDRVGKQDRGLKILKYSYERGFHSVSALDSPSVIIEPFFGSNMDDAALGLDKKQDIAKALSCALLSWFGDGGLEC